MLTRTNNVLPQSDSTENSTAVGEACLFARDSILCYSAYMLSPVRPSVCHTGGSVKNGWS